MVTVLRNIKPAYSAGVYLPEWNREQLEEAMRLWKEMGTDSPYFKRWFGNSKVVDRNGKPRRMYHMSTAAGFTKFDTMMSKDDIGSHFGTVRQARQVYNDVNGNKLTGTGMEGLGTYCCYLKIENPLLLPDLGNFDGYNIVEYLRHSIEDTDQEALVNALEKREKVLRRLKPNVSQWSFGYNEFIVNFLKQFGYDGLKYLNEHEGRGYSFAVFDANQIKSVTNRGTFDPNSDEIMESYFFLRMLVNYFIMT